MRKAFGFDTVISSPVGKIDDLLRRYRETPSDFQKKEGLA